MTDHPPAAILGATRAVAACNIGWKTAIDDPATVARAALDAAAPHLAAAERERIRMRSIERIAAYVLARRDGEAVGVTEFVDDLIRQEAP